MTAHPNPIVIALIKFLDGKDACKVLRGNLKLGSVKYFRRSFEEERHLRGDPNECLYAYFGAQSNTTIVVRYRSKSIGEMHGPLREDLSIDNRSYLFCMSAVTSRSLIEGEHYLFDPRIEKFGDKAVLITNPSEFVRRINQAVQEKAFLKAFPGTGGQASGLVEYLDFNTHRGAIGPFRKSKNFVYQNEWRLAVVDSSDEIDNFPDTRLFNVGDLTDIAFTCDTTDLIECGLKLDKPA